MNFVEFTEALSRVADKLSIPNPRIDEVDPEEPPDPVVIRQWGRRPLSEKIEAFLLTCAQNCLGKKAFDDALTTLEAFLELENIYANDIEITNGTKKLEKGIKDY